MMTFADLTYRLADLWMKSFSRVKWVGPLATGSDEYARMIEFRTAQNRIRAPYLEENFQQEIEQGLEIDARSLHFVLQAQGKIVACVRATPKPFELSALAQRFAQNTDSFERYLELGRLCTEVNLDRKGFYAGLLVVRTAQYLFSQGLAAGLVGICRLDRVAYMKKLGLIVDLAPVMIPARQSEYQLVYASKEQLLKFYFQKFFGFLSLQDRRGSPEVEKHESYSA